MKKVIVKGLPAKKAPAKKAPAKRRPAFAGLRVMPQWMSLLNRKTDCDDLFLLPDGISSLLEDYPAVARGFYLVFRTRKVIRKKKTWLQLHPDFEKAVDFVEKSRTKGASWEIHPWPALQLKVKATEVLLVPTREVFPDSLVRKIQQGNSFDFAMMETEFIKATSTKFLFQKGLQPLTESDLDHYCLSSVSSAWGEWYDSMYEPLEWPVMASSEGIPLYKHLSDDIPVESPREQLIEELKHSISGKKLEFSVIDNRTGGVIAAVGSVVGAAEIEAIIESRASLLFVPEGAGEELEILIETFSPYL